MKPCDAPTMKDVAREAGVSLGTVSKVINGIPVGEQYRKRVEAAIEKLGYQVNNYARGLKTNKTYCVALVMPSLHHPFFAVLVNELSECLMQQGYRSLLMITNYDSLVEKKCFSLAQQNKIDGIIALTYSPDLDVDESISVVTIDRHISNHPCVSSDNFHGGELAAEKLMELGCKKLLFLHIGNVIVGEAEKRGPGFENACRTAGADYHSIWLTDQDTEAPFFRFLEEHIHNGKLEYDGIFCNSDGLGVRVCEFLKARGIRIPEDVQIIGYDGIVDYATGRYGCSTIVQPIPLLAETCVDILLKEDKSDLPSLLCLPEDNLEDITEVNSHPVALMQCRDFLSHHPRLKVVEAEDTAGSAEIISREHLHGHAAICSKFAAPLYGMKVLEEGIETNKHNFTRFLVFSQPQRANLLRDIRKANKASLVFILPHEQGSLSQVLSIFSFYKMNLTKIQSLPLVGKEWQYMFYVDLGFDDYTRYSQSIDAITPLTQELKILGEYQDGRQTI